MPRTIRARGAVVDALKRYDPALRVRWSFEKKMWAIDAPMKYRDDNFLVPPVRFEEISKNHYVEHLLPELSERYINYHDGTYTICWAKRIDWPLYYAVVLRDSQRMKGGAVGQFIRNQIAERKEKENSAKKLKEERTYEVYDRFKFLNRTQPWGDPVGGGISTKGMKLED